MILAMLEMTALPAKRKEFLQTVQAMIQKIRKEKGCIKCYACQDIEDENTFRLLEEWETQKDLDNHLRSDLFTVLLGVKNLLSEPLEINFTVGSSTTGMEVVKSVRGESG